LTNCLTTFACTQANIEGMMIAAGQNLKKLIMNTWKTL
jgi:hypothetical protein